MNLLYGIDATASALTAEKIRMDVVAENIANAHTTRGIGGEPYQRKVVTFESHLNDSSNGGEGVRVSRIARDQSPGAVILDPLHPDADANGRVTMPNVNIAYEMVDLMTATRAYEANLAVIRNAKQIAARSLSIAR